MLFSSADFPGAISDHLVATADAVDEHAAELQKLVDAWYLTLDWIDGQPRRGHGDHGRARPSVTPEEYDGFAEGTTLFDADQALDAFEDRADDPTSLPEMARRINPFLVESGLTEEEADLDRLFVPDVHRRPTSRATAVERRRPSWRAGGRRRAADAGRRPPATRRRGAPTRRPGRTRGRRQHQLLRIRSPISLRLADRPRRRSASPACSPLWVVPSRTLDGSTSFLVPVARRDVGRLRRDVARRHVPRRPRGRRCSGSASATRSRWRSASWSASPSARFASVEAFFEPQIGFLRYIPASALTPLLLLWLGIGESPKITLIVVGTVFFNILMVADVARAVPRELINAVVHARRRPVDDAPPGHPAALAARASSTSPASTSPRRG